MNAIKELKIYIGIAEKISEAGTCKRMKTGAVIVKDGCIIGTGYNGSAKGDKHCFEHGCDMEHGHCVRCVHAEVNAIINAARSGTSTVEAKMYCTHRPCHRCIKHIINSGISTVYYLNDYRDDRTTEVLTNTGYINQVYQVIKEKLHEDIHRD